MKYITHAALKRKLLKDPEVKKEYDRLAPEYELIASLIEKRLEKGLSQKDLAKKAGTKQSAISRLESGRSNPSLAFLNKIASALNSRVFITFK